MGASEPAGGQAAMMTRMSADLTANDFVSGLLASFARKGIAAVSLRSPGFYTAALDAFGRLSQLAEKYEIDVRFYVFLDPIYGDSPVIREAVSDAVQRNLISLDNPEYQDLRLRIGSDEANLLLAKLPGGPELYEQLAEAFLADYPHVATAT